MHALALNQDRDDRPREDHIVVLHDVTWADYQRMLEIRGERSVPRLSYLEGRLEIRTSSLPHETLKSQIGRLVEVYCLERGIDFHVRKQLERGVEPDECYVFGPPRVAARPDLAIELVWTSGGISKLDIYRKLGVREVWYLELDSRPPDIPPCRQPDFASVPRRCGPKPVRFRSRGGPFPHGAG